MKAKIIQLINLYSGGLFTRTIFFVACLFLGVGNAEASHIAGADITYDCLGQNQYEVTLTLYRDCDGIGMSSLEYVNFMSSSCGLSQNNNILSLDTVMNMTQLCPSAISTGPCNGVWSSYIGYEAYVYKGIVTLSQSCPDWIVSWSSCCRNSAITTLSSTPDLYIEALINSTICNDAPIFTGNPIGFYCAGNCNTLSSGVYDPDQDSLLFELTCPLEASNNCIGHVGGLSTHNPFFTSPSNSFSLDANTGEISFCTSSGFTQFAVVKLTISQIKNGVVIGYVQRDLPFNILNNSNCSSAATSTTPALIQGNGNGYSFSICKGDTLSFSSIVHDVDGDTISIDTAQSSLNAVFGANNWSISFDTMAPYRSDSALMEVEINTSTVGIGLNYLIIGLTDNICPIPGKHQLNFTLNVIGVEAFFDVNKEDALYLCPGIAHQVPLGAASTISGGSYQWTQISGPTVTFSNDTILAPILSVPNNTISGDSIVLELTNTGTSCSSTDRITIYLNTVALDVTLLASNQTLCPNGVADTVYLSATINGPNIDWQNGVYTWSANPSAYLGNLSSTTINNPIALLDGNYGDSLSYTLNYTYGTCVGADDITFHFDAATMFAQGDTTICPGDTIQMTSIYSSNQAKEVGICNLNTSTTCIGTNVDLVVGDSSNTTSYPFRGFFEDARTQILYRASELTAAGVQTGLIKELAFYVSTQQSTIPYSNFTIKIGCTSLDEMTSWQPSFLTGLSQVYYDSVTTVQGWNNYVFQIPYEWDGVSNLVVEICYDNNQQGGFDYVASENMTYYSIMTFDDSGVSGCSGLAEQSLSRRPIIRLSNCLLPAPVEYTWTPSLGILNNSDTAAQATVAPLSSTTYVVRADNGYCSIEDSVVVTISSPIPTPILSCGNATVPDSSVLFQWTGGGATSWEYSLDTTATWTALLLDEDSILITGLVPNTCVEIWVRAVDSNSTGLCAVSAAVSLECCSIDPCDGFVASFAYTTSGYDASFLTAIQGGTGPYTYLWNFGDTSTGTSMDPIHSYMDSTTFYPVLLTVTDSNACIATFYDTLYFPVAIPCHGQELFLEFDFDQYASEISWSIEDTAGTTVWSHSNYSSNQNNTQVSERICLPDGCYTFRIYDAYGDGMCCLYGNGAYRLQDSSGQILGFGGPFGFSDSRTFCLGGANACNGFSLNFSHVDTGNISTFIPITTINPVAYLWNFGDSTNLVNTAQPSHAFVPSGASFPVCLTAVDSLGCTETFCDTISAGLSSCPNMVYTLILALDNFAEETSWNLLDSAGNVLYSETYDSSQSGMMIYRNFCLPTGCYDFVISDLSGDGLCCGWGMGGYTIVDTLGTVLVHGGAFSTVEQQNFCTGGAINPCASLGSTLAFVEGTSGLINFTSQVQGGIAPYTYHWDFENGDSSSLANPSSIYALNGIYEACVTITDAIGCTTVNCHLATVTTVLSSGGIACDSMAADMNIWQDSLHPFNLYLQPIVNNAPIGGQFEFFWNFGDGSSTIGGLPTHHYSNYGTYEISLIVMDTINQCAVFYSDTISVDSLGNFSRTLNYKDNKPGFDVNGLNPIINFITTTKHLEVLPVEIALSPNPAINIIDLKIQSRVALDATITLLDIHGKTLESKGVYLKHGQENWFSIPVDQLASGIYLIKVSNDKFQKTLKFVKQ